MTTTETAPLTLDTEDHWTWIQNLIADPTEDTAVATCTRCGRTLTSTKSIAATMGRTCAKKTRQAVAVKDVKPATVAKAAELIEQGGILPLRGRRVFQVVSSDGTATYKTAPQACTCAAGIKGRFVCYHRVAAVMLAA